MATHRCVKWAKDAKELFDTAPDGSLVLDVFISHACRSQTGEGFEELVNSINSENIKKKIKKVNIHDTSYLYRHVIPNFSKYVDSNIPTEWFLNNKDSIEKLTVDVNMKAWVDGINSDEFERWYNQIKTDFVGDQDERASQELRDAVLQEASEAALKGGYNLGSCIDFILEECADACVTLKNTILVYPAKMSAAIMNCVRRYGTNVVLLSYKTSKPAQLSNKCVNIKTEILEKEVTRFMREEVLNVNFYVIDKYGNHIYKNYTLDNVVGDINVKELDQKAWSTCLEVIETGKQKIIEEETPFGNIYLTVKAPLMINKKIEGVIGLAIDITDRKKAEKLESQNAKQQVEIDLQNKIRTIFERFVRKINPQLTELAGISEASKNLSEGERTEIVAKIICINVIIKDLLTALQENSLENFAGMIK